MNMGNWKTCTIADLGMVVGGATPSTKEAENYDGGTIAWITPKDLAGYSGRFISHGERDITEIGLHSCSAQMMPRHSVLFSSRAPIGYVAIAENELCTNQGFKSVVPNENTDYMFLYYLLLNNRQRIEYMGSGTTFKEVSGKTMRSIEVRVPESKEEQIRISSILSTIDDKIEENERINKNLYQQVVALYSSLFGKPTQQTSSVGQYSEQIYSGGTPSTSKSEYWNGEFHWFSSGETRNRFAITTDKTITKAGVDNSSTKLAHKYDIVMASAGQGFTRGQTTMLLLDTYVNQSVIVIHANHTVLPYLFWNLAGRYDELRAISDSSSIRGSLTTKMIAGFVIPEVDSESLAEFSEFAWPVISEIENNLLENQRLSTLRDTLLPRLMSGEIDISDIDL